MSTVTVLKLLIVLLSVLIAVAFVTLLERKMLSYTQIRKGPNKLGFKGILQPIGDALKLFTKESMHPSVGNYSVYWFSASLALILALSLWVVFPSSLGNAEVGLGLIFILCLLTAGVYSTLGAGCSSNSKYSLLGGLRAVAQTISYEVSLAFLIFSVVILLESYWLAPLFNSTQYLIVMSLPLATMWMISLLAETSRTPFDFSEGESELVSGFNTEYSAGPFALFFLAEYSSILFASLLMAGVFFTQGDFNPWVGLKMAVLASLFVWVRATLPRLRYDKLMELAWKTLLLVSLNHLLLFMGVLAVLKNYFRCLEF